ncbi:hypothetical protein KA344_01645 [bacterium]|nr:hypothetical protein [bacterium]
MHSITRTKCRYLIVVAQACSLISIYWLSTAQMPVQASDNKKALELIDRQLAKDPADETRLNSLKEELDRIIKKRPDAYAFVLRATVRFNLKDGPGAILDCNEAIKLDGKLERAYALRGMNYCLMRQPENALKDLTKAVELKQDNSGAYLFKALAELQLANSAAAIIDFTHVIELEKDTTVALLATGMRGQAYLAARQYDLAIADADKILQYKGEHLPEGAVRDAHKIKGTALFAQKKMKEAVMELRLSIVGAPSGRTVIAIPGTGPAPDSKAAEKAVGTDATKLETAKTLGFRPIGSPPPDRPVRDSKEHMDAILAPYVEQARKTLPAVKERYLKGLPPGQSLSVTTRLLDSDGKQMEQVFVTVVSWNKDYIEGTLNSEVKLNNYKYGEPLLVLEKDVLDWTILRPDGSEEGNVIGKFLDTQH